MTGISSGVRLKIFASVLGVDRGETLLGVPAFVAPVVAFLIPEIALFKWVSVHRRRAGRGGPAKDDDLDERPAPPNR